jgi:nucleoside-diphosphate-sugar epimerase
MMSGKLALVTGAAGFVGSHLSARLVREGWRVRGVDCFTPYYDPALKERNLLPLSREPRFELVRADLREADPAALLAGVDTAWHLAAQAGVRSSWGRSFEEYTSLNINATQRLLEAARHAGLRKLVCASSSSVYGEAPVYPMPEDGPQRPISPYGVTKLAAEHLARLYALAYGVPTVSLRYFTVYGPRQRPDMGFHRFFRAILAGEELTLFGDGSQSRDFTIIDDVTEANLRAAEHGEPGEVYNISGGSRVTVLEVIAMMEKITGRTARVARHPRQDGDPQDTGGDSARARERLGFEPRVGLEEGLGRMAAWMERWLRGEPE